MGFSTARQWLFSRNTLLHGVFHSQAMAFLKYIPHILATMVTTATGKQMTNEEKNKTHFYTHTHTHTHTDYENQ